MATGCYTERYLPGSYKGVSFKVKETGSEHGRRGAEGEFPFGEQTGYADMGRRIRTYSVSARFDNNEHILSAAALIAVCELPGPGPLVHPTRGLLTAVACKSVKVTDRIEEEGGVTYVDMEFVEANLWPNGLSLTSQALGLAISPLIQTSRDSFTARYQPQQVQTFREDAVVGAVSTQINAIADQYVTATLDQATSDARNRIVYDLRAVASVDGQASDPDTADRGLTLGAAAVAQNMSGVDKFDAFRALANGAANTSVFGEPAASAENAVYAHVRVLCAAYMAEGAVEATGVNANQIFEMAAVIDAVVEQEMLYARNICDNFLFLGLSEFRGEVAQHLNAKAYKTPGFAAFDFGGAVHPLVAAYAIFGDATRHREIEETNVVNRTGRVGSPVIGNV